MSEPNDRPAETDDEPPETPLYAALELEDGDLVVYDESNHRAWVQSNRTVSLAACA